MQNGLVLIAIFSSSVLAGCVSMNPLTPWPTSTLEFDVEGEGQDVYFVEGCELEGHAAARMLKKLAKAQPKIKRPATPDGPIDLYDFPSTHSPIATRILLSKTPTGSYVHLIDKSNNKFMGVLLSADTKKVVLRNCLSRESVTNPDGQVQGQMSHVRLGSIMADSFTHMTVFSVPPREVDRSSLEEQTPDEAASEIVFASGLRQRLHGPSGTGQPAEQLLPQLAPGTQVGLRDDRNVWFEGTLAGIRPDEITLENSASLAIESDPAGRPQTRTTFVLSLPLRRSSIAEVVVLPSPAQSAESDEDSCDHCVDAIVLKSGRRLECFLPFADDSEGSAASQASASETIRTRYVLSDGVEKVRVREIRRVDSRGRVRTEDEIVSSEPVPGGLPALEAELFEAARAKSAVR